MKSNLKSLQAGILALHDHEDFHRKLAEILMIEADGGDDPAAFVRDAISEAFRQLSIDATKSRLNALEENVNNRPLGKSDG